MENEKIPYKIINNMDEEYKNIVNNILNSEEFIKRKNYHHHENRSVYYHSLMVSYRTYKIAKKFKLDYQSAAIAGLLHDFYYKDWQLNRKKENVLKAHGFIHATEALENSKKNYPELINKKVEDGIKRHMFPLNFIPPRYLESWIICLVDKYCSFEVFKTPQQLYKYIGLRKKGE